MMRSLAYEDDAVPAEGREGPPCEPAPFYERRTVSIGDLPWRFEVFCGLEEQGIRWDLALEPHYERINILESSPQTVAALYAKLLEDTDDVPHDARPHTGLLPTHPGGSVPEAGALPPLGSAHLLALAEDLGMLTVLPEARERVARLIEGGVIESLGREMLEEAAEDLGRRLLRDPGVDELFATDAALADLLSMW